MHSNIHTFAVNPFVPIILNNKHYSLIYLGTGPTSNMSDYSVNASAESPAGSWPALPPSYYSPHTMENIFTTNANINASTLHNIATSQVQTIKNHKEIYHFATIRFEDRIKRLKAKIQDYAETYKTAPDRYMYNTNYPDLRIPLREGIYTEAYWVTLAHNRYIQAYSQEQGPLDTPYSLPIYAHPVYLADPTEPIPTWFHQLLTGTPAVYANFAKAAHWLDDWGIAADIVCYWKLDDDLSCINVGLERLNAKVDAIRISKMICEGWLELACAPKQLVLGKCRGFVTPRGQG